MMCEVEPQLQTVDTDPEKKLGLLMQGSAITEFNFCSTSQCRDRSRMLIVNCLVHQVGPYGAGKLEDVEVNPGLSQGK